MPASDVPVFETERLLITRDDILKRIVKQVGSEFERLLVVVLKASGRALGECMMHGPDEKGIARTDVKLLPVFWGKGYGVEVKRGLLDHLFEHTDCVAVEATPNVGNAASIRMQEAVGGVRIGEAVCEFPESMRNFTTPVHHYIYRVERRSWKPPSRTTHPRSD
jgi:RimJ/RimL family protein N-acetyltransferase